MNDSMQQIVERRALGDRDSSAADPINRKRRRFLALGALGVSLCVTRGHRPAFALGETASANAFDAEVASFWFDETLRTVRETVSTPPAAARAIGYVSIAVYEAARVATGHRSLAGQLNGLRDVTSAPADVDHHAPSVIAAAVIELLPTLFPARDPVTIRIGEVNAMRFTQRYEQGIPAEQHRRSRELGGAIGRAIGEWSKEDGAATQDLTFPKVGSGGRHPPSATGEWVPTGFEYNEAMLPRWGSNRPFVLPSAEVVDPGPPPAFSREPDSPFYREAKRVYDAVKAVTPEQSQSALFWADNPGQSNTPAGHWIAVLGQVLRDRHSSLDEAVASYARLGITLNDVAIACWYTKYRYKLVRPVTYIHEVIDPRFEPLMATPPFPEYTSGHSAISAAAAEILTRQFGTLSYIDLTNKTFPFGKPRRFDSFAAAAREAALSRFYAGIHYESAIERGLEQGQRVAERVNVLDLRV
ncbi:MAG: vanadium-dependent haloperoxidase [Pseudomonadota bacterium]|nr:vanadium-dependent haloperoxidase [Pseudomonadota bacterium]